MSHSITVSPDSKYIILKVIGNIDRQTGMVYNLEAHKIGKLHGINRYLSDFTECRNTDSVINNYSFAYDDMNTNEEIDVTAVVAVVVSKDDHSHDFIETVTQNSGLNLTLFHSKQAAIDYLLNSYNELSNNSNSDR